MDTDKVIQDLNRRFAAPLPEQRDFSEQHSDFRWTDDSCQSVLQYGT